MRTQSGHRRLNRPLARPAEPPVRCFEALFVALVSMAIAIGCGSPQAQRPGEDGGRPDVESTGMCAEPNTRCGADCVRTMSSSANCGACGNACPAHHYCVAGECMRTCPSGFTSCDEECVDLSADRDNCGECGMACPMDRMCRGGHCGCPMGYTECEGRCVDPKTDAMNCGICGRTCGGETQCYEGTCTRSAPGREMDCNNDMDDDGDGRVDCRDMDCSMQTRPCEASCGAGVETCGADGSWSECHGGNGEGEVCGDGIDQDCDGADLTAPDEFEPNNSCEQCRRISSSIDPNLRVTPRFDSAGDEVDCFFFEADDEGSWSNEHVYVNVTAVPEGHDYDVWLYYGHDNCASGTWIAKGEREGNADERLDWEEGWGDDDGTYYVVVRRFGGYSCDSSYRLEVNGLNFAE